MAAGPKGHLESEAHVPPVLCPSLILASLGVAPSFSQILPLSGNMATSSFWAARLIGFPPHQDLCSLLSFVSDHTTGVL